MPKRRQRGADGHHVDGPGLVMVPTSGSDVAASAASDVTCEVVVIGAGLAGLTAAYELLSRDAGIQLCVLEASGRVGGRTLTTEMLAAGGKKDAFDLGAQWLSYYRQSEIMRMLCKLGLDEFDPPFAEAVHLGQVGEDTTWRYSGAIPQLGSLWADIKMEFFIDRVNKLAERMCPLNPCREEAIRRLDGLSVEGFAREHMSDAAALDVVNAACRLALGCDASRVSVVHFLMLVRAAGGFRNLLQVDVPGSARGLRVEGGAQRIAERLADRVGRHRLYLDQPVCGVTQRPDGSVTVTTAAGTAFHCQHVIAAVSPRQLAGIHFQPPLDPVKRELIANMQMGQVIQFVVTFREAHWREAGYSGHILSFGGRSSAPDCRTGPLCVVYDATTYSGTPALGGIIAGSTCTEWQAKTKAEREHAVIASLAEFFGRERTESYIEYQEQVWADEPYAAGSAACYAPPGLAWSLPALARPHGRVRFCGAELAARWPGSMDGAVETGCREALETLDRLRRGALRAADREQLNQRRAELRHALELPEPPATTSIRTYVMVAVGIYVVARVFWHQADTPKVSSLGFWERLGSVHI